MLKIRIILVVSIFFILSGCATIYNPATGQKEFIYVTTPAEVSIGKVIALKISKQYKISKEPKKIDRLKKIGKNIAAVSDRKDLKYTFFVIEDDSLNAFTTPGGYIYIHSGVLDKANDDELACVIGHEVGHVAARHIAKKLQAQIGYNILMTIATREANIGVLQKAASVGYDLMMLGYSRGDEIASDKLGVKYAYKAKYDPYAMIKFLKRLEDAKEGEMGLVFLRSHPYASQRIKVLEKEIPGIINKVDKKPIKRIRPAQKKKQPKVKALSKDEKRPFRVMCPTCKKVFPGKMVYCPYDGTKLQ